jgi:glycosyltransferase involved in cell wall biosynthesis
MTPGPGSEPGYRVVCDLTAGILSGVDTFMVRLVRALLGQGVPARVLLTRPAPYADAELLPLPADIPVDVLPPWPIPWRQRWSTLVRYLEDLAPCVYLPNYDYDFSCVCPALSPDIVVVGIAHSDDPRHYEHARRLGRYWDATVAVSPAIAEQLKVTAPEAAARLEVLPYGVAVSDTPPTGRPDRGPLRIAYAGRLEQGQKRVLDLPPILARLHEAGVAAELTIAGDGIDRAALREAFRSLPATSVRWLGTVSNDAVVALLAESDALLLPSQFEGLPLTLLEAMAAGCVPVVSDIRSGVPLLVDDGVTGFRVPVGDVGSFAARLTTLARDRILLARLSRAAWRRVHEGGYSIEAVGVRYQDLFARALAQARAGVYRRPRGAIQPPPWFEQRWLDRLTAPVRHLAARARAGWVSRQRPG